eukprot:COSAG02_NODE_37678_length_439_cov_0.523529_1_plen_117_part_10
MMERKMAQLIAEHMQAPPQNGSQTIQQSENVPICASAARATAGSIPTFTALESALSQLPSVNGRHTSHSRPRSERRSRLHRGPVESTATRASSARGSSRDFETRDDSRWAAEWVAAQ